MIVNYNWQKIPNLNWLAIHRSEPIIAYVINPSYTTSLIKNTVPDPEEQVLRIINYDDRMLGICKAKFLSPVADLCFSYNCPSQKETLIAAMDRSSNINVFSYCEDLINQKGKYEVKLLLEVKANSFVTYETLALSWCPYVGSEDDEENDNDNDPGTKLAIASEKSIEVLSVDKLVACNSEFKRSELDQEEHDYIAYYDQTSSSIIKIFLSSDGNAVCTASKDNSVKFFQLDSSELRQMHSWEPAISDFKDKISFFHFLDDYNKLLENYQHEFWGFAFVGTENGEISIWNLREWNSLQRLKINCDDLGSATETVFKYKADITSHFITAIKGETVFIIQISFDSLTGDLEKTPKITKITRFQQYNQILSFVCKRTNDKELDLFWLTPKSLERCTIQTDQLVEENKDQNKNPLFNNLPANSDGLQNKSLPNIENGVIKKATNENNKPHNSTLQNPISLLKYFGSSFKTTFSNSPNQSAIKNVSSLDQIEKPSTPTSQEVENLFNHSNTSTSSGKQPPAQSIKTEIDLNKILPPQLNKSENSNFHSFSSKNAQKGSNENLNATNISLPSALDVSALVSKENYNQLNNKLNELIKLTGELKKNQEDTENEKKLNSCRLDLIEEKLISEMAKSRLTVTEEITKVSNEIEGVRKEWKDPNEFKFMNKITEQFLKKLMDQLNQTISKGLEEFMGQMRSELNDLATRVNKVKTQLDTKLEQCCKKNDKFTKQLNDVMDRFKEISDQQQNFSQELVLNLNHLRQLPSVSPSPKLNNSLSSVSFSSVYSKEDEEKQLKEEKIRKIWTLIRTQDVNKILEAVSLALNLKDEQVITKLLQHFVDKHTSFIGIIKKDQTVLISLLNQLTLHPLEKEPWKIKFLPDIITSLDMNSTIVKNNLHLFINKLIDKLKSIQKMENINKDDTANLPLILFVLNQCKTNM